ncbi:MAG: hypothetical protein IJM62_00490 [Lachnospiraceae bacterium]|nr:hypothetical protein [Lachnospiraceae bacterium]
MSKNRKIGIVLLVLGILAVIGFVSEYVYGTKKTLNTSEIIAIVLTGAMIVGGIYLIITGKNQ